MNVILFEDSRVDLLWPITLGRAAATIACGGRHLTEVLTDWNVPVASLTRPYLPSDAATLRPTTSLPASTTLLLNARAVPLRSVLEQLRLRLKSTAVGSTAWHGDQLVATLLDGTDAVSRDLQAGKLSGDQIPDRIRSQPSKPWQIDVPLLEYPHDVIRCHPQCLQENLNHAITVGEFDEIRKGVYASDESVCGQFVTADTSAGPIVLHTASIVEPHAHLRGPLWVGEQAIVRSHASVRGGVAVGSHSRIGGEVQDSVVEPYSNKQHLGFLGHSYLGSWVNWGAGTSNSNLKNTYGSVKMLYGQKQIDTGMTFLGCIVGDHVKSAINTSIFSGKTIGPCSMLYGFVTENVPAFTNFARQFGDITEIALETAIEGERRMMARRNVAMTAERQAMLREIFERTRDQRQDLPCRPPRF